MFQQPLLSKSRFISGSQCHLRLWNDTHARELASKPSSTLQAIFDTGQIVGELACKRHPGGRLIAQDYRHTREALHETTRALEDETCPALFEAAFVHQGVLVRADIIERLPDGAWRLIEVKSGTRAKDVFVRDLAIQFWVLVGAGLDVRDAGVLTLNRNYVYDGEHLDLQGLFRYHPLMPEVEGLQDGLLNQVASMLTTLEADAPNIPPGDHCFVPYRCPYHDHCTRGLVTPQHPIGEIYRLSPGMLEQLQLSNIVGVSDIPDSFPLNNLQSVVRESVKENRHILHGDVQGPLARLTPPIHHLDFETFAPALPRFAGTRPFEAIPFLFSVHRENEGNAPTHVDYLHEGMDDPRPRLVEELISALGQKGSICTYSGYERTVIDALARALPEQADALRAIRSRLFDLLNLLRSTYYHPDFHGSFSIKRVLPVLCPDLSYKDLGIEDGQSAAHEYMRALEENDLQVRQRIFKDLRAYCELDTLAMVRLKEALAQADGEHRSEKPARDD